MTTVDAERDLAFAGPGALAGMVRDKQVTARELVELFLRRIEELNPRLNAFRITLADGALAAADAQAGADPADAGPLTGVPIAVKDDVPVAGEVTTQGSCAPAPRAPADAEVVRRLRAAGAIPIGITNVPELMIFPWTASDANGITRNPWDLSRTPGGSSGGTAAAVAAGLVPAGTASDGGGSIRIPAACCGLVGMKPTRGRVSTQPFSECWAGLSVFGALTRTVADSALMLDTMHGSVVGDADRAPAPNGTFLAATRRDPGRLRIAISRKLPTGVFAPISDDQRLAWDRTARLLGELGHDVEERHPAYGLASLEFSQTYLRAIYDEFAKLSDPSLTEPSTRQMATAGRLLVTAGRRDALRAKRRRTSERIMSLWNDVDVLLTPGLASTAIAAEGGYGRAFLPAFDKAARFTPWTPVFNFTGQPAISVPAGMGSDRLPLAVQLVGRIGAEETLYSLAAQIESAQPWATQRPAL